MNTKKMTTEYRMAQWSQLLQERKETGESVADFCQNRGLSKSSYFYWQKKLREAACEQFSKSATALTPSGWAMCNPTEKSAKIFVEIGSCRVAVDDGFNPELLAQVCKALVSLC